MDNNNDDKELSIDKESELHDSTSDHEQKKQIDPELQKLLNESSSDSDDEDIEKLFKNKNKNPRKKVIAGAVVGALVLFGAAGASFFFVNGNGLNFESNEKQTRAVSDKIDPETGKEFWKNEDGSAKSPIEREAWLTDSNRTLELSSDQMVAITGEMLGTELYEAAMTLPSELDGFTSDNALEYNEDGSLNTQYSFWTREVFVSEASRAIYTLLDPVAGNYSAYQFSTGNALNLKLSENEQLSKFFTNDFISKADANAKLVPIYADWEGNDYGETNLVDGSRFFGEVTGSKTTFTYNDETLSYDVESIIDVRYVAFLKDGNKLTKDGVLKINFIANQERAFGPSGKVLINSSTLTFN